ncbi:MAG: oligopeptide transporter, OPT family [Gammaproteobacteria bacterium]|nr:oligopeptide transporter, OPT family [Gammaproteobacteria bacterium]
MQNTANLPQLSVKAVLLGVILAIIMAGANAYLALFAGQTVSASIPASVISMAVLRLLGGSNILENNVVQNAASAGESVAAGAVFTFPALVLLGFWQSFDYGWVLALAGVGGVLGVLFTIPLRRSLILEEKLVFPEGTATAEVLKVGASGQGIRALGFAALAGAIVKFSETGLHLWDEAVAWGRYVGTQTVAYVGCNISPALLAVGYIVGINIAALVFTGGVIAWFMAMPIFTTWFMDSNPQIAAMAASGASAVDLGGAIWSKEIRYLGVGAMLVGAIWALISMRRSILSGIRSGLMQYRGATLATANVPETDKDMPMKWVGSAILVLVVPIFFLYQYITGSLRISVPMTIIMVVTGFLFSSVAGYMAGLVGSSNNPLSGVTIATVLFTSLVLVGLMGSGNAAGPAAAIMVGAVVCCAAAIAGDNLQDLKAGQLVGATPWKLQLMQSIGAVSGVLVMAPVLNLLNTAYGIGVVTPEHPNPLTAPQATLMAAVAQGVFHGDLPWVMVSCGAVIGVIIIVVDQIALARKWPWRAPVLAVAVGIYLPLELSTAIFIGGLVAWFAGRFTRRSEPGIGIKVVEDRLRTGMLFAAGLITGEALLGILLAIPIVLSGRVDVVAVQRFWPGVDPGVLGAWPGVVVMAGLVYALYRVATNAARGRAAQTASS